MHPPSGLRRESLNRGIVVSTSRHSEPLETKSIAGGGRAPEHPQLKPSILGIIDAYRMGTALDARELYRTSGKGIPGGLKSPGRS
jgi:hypothetical protein